MYILCHTWSLIFFWYLFAITVYWFIVYKLMSRAYLFLPDVTDYESTYQKFDAVFGTLLATQFITVVLKIVAQSSYDIFFIDWESSHIEERQGKQVSKVNVWRSLLVANETSEMMSEGLISVTMNYIIFVFFL